MNLFSPKAIKNLLAQYRAKPLKRMGQNFLIDENILQKILMAAELKSEDTVVEVGPGIGTLTQALAKHAKQVIAIEKDRTMVAILNETLKDYRNIQIISADILRYKLQATSYKIIANIPYYLTSPLIRKFLETPTPPETMVLMVQKEVAQRICAKPPDMSLLAVSVQFYAQAKIISYVSKNCFWPAPKVDSAIIKIIPHGKEKTNATLFFKIMKAGFKQPRKQLGNNLAKYLKKDRREVEQWLTQNDINPKQRPETLTIDNWKNLTHNYNTIIDNPS